MAAPKILFIHRNFPGQFRGLAPYLAKNGWEVFAASGRGEVDTKKISKTPDGVSVIGYRPTREPATEVHAYLRGMDAAVVEGQGLANLALRMKKSGIMPDIVVAHSGWGSGSYAKAVWPEAKFVQYLEWWYNHPARDGDPVPPGTAAQEAEARAKTLMKNLPFMLDAAQADAIMAPTAFQAADLPGIFRNRLHILHDGVDCDLFHPETDRLPQTFGEAEIGPDQPIVTYATRGMEPMRGFPEFMAAWAQVQQSHPDAHCVIAGTDTIHYGPKLPEGDSFLKRALAADEFDRSRLHIVGRLTLADYAALLRRSDCHCYLTKPFVLSWSLTEAMASGARLVVSDVAPVREVLPKETQALHVDHSDIHALANAMRQTLDDPKSARARGVRARKFAERHFATRKIFPAHDAFFRKLIAE